jgi:hypothetical protein
MAEREPPSHHPDREGPQSPTELPPELATFLRSHDYVCITQATDQGTAFVMKIPGAEIQSVRGTMLVELRQQLYDHPAAPVIRLVFTLYDQLDSPIRLETFINVAEEGQRTDYAALSDQEALPLLFYDESLTHQLTKLVPFHNQEDSAALLHTAQELLVMIPEGERDFDTAKAAVMQATQL